MKMIKKKKELWAAICSGRQQPPTFCGRSEDLFRDVELVLRVPRPVLHPPSALHGEVDVAGDRRHRLSLDSDHWTDEV